jgi:hypothetical protein
MKNYINLTTKLFIGFSLLIGCTEAMRLKDYDDKNYKKDCERLSQLSGMPINSREDILEAYEKGALNPYEDLVNRKSIKRSELIQELYYRTKDYKRSSQKRPASAPAGTSQPQSAPAPSPTRKEKISTPGSTSNGFRAKTRPDWKNGHRNNPQAAGSASNDRSGATGSNPSQPRPGSASTGPTSRPGFATHKQKAPTPKPKTNETPRPGWNRNFAVLNSFSKKF